MDSIRNDIVQPLREQGQISDDVYVNLAGNADKLQQTRNAMFGNWTGFNAHSLLALIQSRGFLALLVVYLLMAALFESFIHPLSILFTVPLAMVGGFLGLKLVFLLSLQNPITPIQTMDVVTMLGFVILLGIVVNNAILIVHQTLNNLRTGMSTDMALQESVRTRIRPIFMTAFTTIGGQIPLALMSGAGSELYRGLAAVMVGGLFCSTLFTIVLVPVVFSMFLNGREHLMRWLGRESDRERSFTPAHEQTPKPVPATGKSLEYATKD
jgi:HAE1 family hydrophobic/amphiphilic exporter-1